MSGSAALRAWLIARAEERTTVIGLIGAVCTLGGWTIAPDQAGAIATVVGLIASAALVCTVEQRSGEKPDAK